MTDWNAFSLIRKAQVADGGEAMFYSESLQRFGFRSDSLLSKALSTLSKRDIVTKNKTYHIPNVMLKKWILSTLPV
jgi:hypothetical protein